MASTDQERSSSRSSGMEYRHPSGVDDRDQLIVGSNERGICQWVGHEEQKIELAGPNHGQISLLWVLPRPVLYHQRRESTQIPTELQYSQKASRATLQPDLPPSLRDRAITDWRISRKR